MDSVDEKFLCKIRELADEFSMCENMLGSVEVVSDPKLFLFYQTKARSLKNVSEMYSKFCKLNEDIELSKNLAELENDANSRETILKEMESLKIEVCKIFEQMKVEILSPSQAGEERARVEISAKNGAIDFADEIENLFEKTSQNSGLKISVIKSNAGSKILSVNGAGAFQTFGSLSGLYEKILRGVSSFVTVLVLEEKFFDIEFKDEDFEIQTSKSGGAGGQHINKTESAVRIKHIPTGLVCECQDERSQQKNKERAMQNLKDKILKLYNEKKETHTKSQRNSLKTAIFSETPVVIFDFDKNIVSVNKTKKVYTISEIMSGNLGKISNDLKV